MFWCLSVDEAQENTTRFTQAHEVGGQWALAARWYSCEKVFIILFSWWRLIPRDCDFGRATNREIVDVLDFQNDRLTLVKEYEALTSHHHVTQKICFKNFRKNLKIW
jgi:hypothetical protein